ncbi:MAG TPA: hypothetical protein VEL03_11265 [Streptosporangiaceae bacterium]|nr:hypothetical protein [Streptosporangiaceae bacterium]
MGSVFALVSPGGSPGVTTAALALALSWPAPVIVAECDPGGGSVLAGALGGHLPGGFALVEHAIEAGRNPAAAAASLPGQLVPLDTDKTRMVLPGLTDPRQAVGLASAWPAVASTFAAQQCDVIADCGRLDAGDGQPLAVLAAASIVVLVLRPTLRQAWAARPRIEMLGQLLGSTERVCLLVTGPGRYPAREMASALGAPVIATLPDDASSAAVLSDGQQRRRFTSGELMAAAKRAGQALRRQAGSQAGAQAPAGDPQVPAGVAPMARPSAPGASEYGTSG